ncbi:low molecular weight phosphotyrosine protein phosphatase [Parashewanella curva]|uniref:Low molecular weight phosphotyrosine protein phosphatase n=1 Tax=Parashewanella curva TaxID=2338552 RepID=A0A3L8PVK5_9GAMM|nr:low molecular weight protein-tyrosine-phosphatase [Parashewanella curva]RLV58092.1 low molecular weight phosphotyrosine protein phosphatase [Parashewanella curva]
MKTKSILFVCMGNICRSPTAEAVFRHKFQQAGIDIKLDSAGTIGFHQGKLPDPRSRFAGEHRGYDFAGITSRQVVAKDFADFDLILAADNANLKDLQMICPIKYRHKLKLMLSFSSSNYQEVPDPYYGVEDGFELVLDLIEASADEIIKSYNTLI